MVFSSRVYIRIEIASIDSILAKIQFIQIVLLEPEIYIKRRHVMKQPQFNIHLYE